MKAWESRLANGALVAVAATGIAYGMLKYFVPATDPDSPFAHPWQPGILKAHLLAAPLFVFGIGLLFRQHALGRLKAGRQDGRRSGMSLLFAAAPLVVSGYSIQVLTGETATRWTGWLHAALGVLFTAVWAFHLRGRAASPTTGLDESGEPPRGVTRAT